MQLSRLFLVRSVWMRSAACILDGTASVVAERVKMRTMGFSGN